MEAQLCTGDTGRYLGPFSSGNSRSFSKNPTTGGRGAGGGRASPLPFHKSPPKSKALDSGCKLPEHLAGRSRSHTLPKAQEVLEWSSSWLSRLRAVRVFASPYILPPLALLPIHESLQTSVTKGLRLHTKALALKGVPSHARGRPGPRKSHIPSLHGKALHNIVLCTHPKPIQHHSKISPPALSPGAH